MWQTGPFQCGQLIAMCKQRINAIKKDWMQLQHSTFPGELRQRFQKGIAINNTYCTNNNICGSGGDVFFKKKNEGLNGTV